MGGHHWRTINARTALFAVGRTDLFTCERCGGWSLKRAFPIHHKDYNGDNNSPDNLEILCRGCHNKVHGRQSRAEAIALKAKLIEIIT